MLEGLSYKLGLSQFNLDFDFKKNILFSNEKTFFYF